MILALQAWQIFQAFKQTLLSNLKFQTLLNFFVLFIGLFSHLLFIKSVFIPIDYSCFLEGIHEKQVCNVAAITLHVNRRRVAPEQLHFLLADDEIFIVSGVLTLDDFLTVEAGCVHTFCR